MSTPVIYRSTDTSAPVLTGAAGDLITLLDACLRVGYGSKSPLGWTKPYTSTNAAVWKQPAGTQMYLQVNDNATLTGVARDASCCGFETMSAYNTGTGQFPTVAQVTNLMVARKSLTADSVARSWFLIGDDRTFYLFVLTGDSAGVYVGFGFGDFYSTISGDSYKCLLISNVATQTTALTAHSFGICNYGFAAITTGGHWIPRNYTGVGGSTGIIKLGDTAMIPNTGAINVNLVGSLGFPNSADGGLYVSATRIVDASTPGGTLSGTLNMRGRMRGLWHVVHATAQFADGDLITGTGDFSGRSFMIVKPVMGATIASMFILEVTDWDTSP